MTVVGWPRGAAIELHWPMGRQPKREAVIQEARDRQHRRRRFVALILVLAAATLVAFGVSRWIRDSNAAPTCVSGACVLSASSALPNPCSLLPSNVVDPIVGGQIVTRSVSPPHPHYSSSSCTWTGPALGRYDYHETLVVTVYRATLSQFRFGNTYSRPRPVPLAGVGVPAYTNISGLQAWKDGTVLELDGPYLTVYRHQAVQLAQIALKRLS